MSSSLKDISQISIYLKDEAERVNEVALFQPLARQSYFDEKSKPLTQRQWRYTQNLSFFRRISLKIQRFLFRNIPALIPTERISPEAKFKTALAMVLSQESLREFFLSNPKRRAQFYQALQSAAQACGYTTFTPPVGDSPLRICRELTFLPEKNVSLSENLVELNLQIATLKYPERNTILYRILNGIERPPITSVLEVTRGDEVAELTLTTKYAKYQVTDWDKQSGKICYRYVEDQATSSIRTQENMKPGAKGVMNQRSVIDPETQKMLGAYSGELSTQAHVLEQILFLLGEKSGEIILSETPPQERPISRKKILFTSLYSWNEIAYLTEQHEAIHFLNHKYLVSNSQCIQLELYHHNISFNAFNKYPTPSEMGATLNDINDEGLIPLTWAVWEALGLSSPELEAIAHRLATLKTPQFLERQKELLEEVDLFRALKKDLLAQLENLPEDPLILALQSLLMPKKVKGIDALLYLDLIAQRLGILHTKNCEHSTDRSAGADAADKGQYAYTKVYDRPFLPGHATQDELALFKVFYSMYLVWEEPEFTCAFSTGFLGEKFHNNFFQKNPETTRYLVKWLRRHPEMYTALSEYRS